MKTPLFFCCLILLVSTLNAQSFKEDFGKGKPIGWNISDSENTTWTSNDSLGVDRSTCMVADYGSNSNRAFSILTAPSVKIDELKEPTLYLTVASVNSNFVAPNLGLFFNSNDTWTELYTWGGHSADSTLVMGQNFSGELQKKNVIWHNVAFSLDSLKSKREIQIGFRADFINGGWILLDNVSLEEKRIVSVREADHTFSLYPNPVNNELHVECEPNVVREVVIHNSLGTMLTRKQVQPVVTKQELDMSTYPSGLYYVSFELTTGAVVTKKILKQ